jgi:long-chain acyl-CoA synthetase
MSQKTIDSIQKWSSCTDLIAIEDQARSITYRQLWNGIQNATQTLDGLKTIGISNANSSEYVVLLLAALARGMTVIPIPHFFSKQQKDAIIQHSDLELIFTNDESLQEFNRSKAIPPMNFDSPKNEIILGNNSSKKIIFTSGTSGSPKGVCLSEDAQEQNIRHLRNTLKPDIRKRYLSLLPFSMLLEEICGLHVVFQSGGTLIIEKDFFDNLLNKKFSSLNDLIAEHEPNFLMIVPDILKFWLFEIELTNLSPPSCLEFIAVGGGKTPIEILEQANDLGLPIFEGYGLSEASSVVSFNVPGESKLGSVGKPFAHHNVKIIGGEIVLEGSALFLGYLNVSREQTDIFFTGDLGHIDSDGYLFVEGRKDNILVTGTGRNVSPEWIENSFNGSVMILKSIAFLNESSEINLLVALSPIAESITKDDLLQRLDKLTQALPAYAKPTRIFRTNANNKECFAENGKPKRKNIFIHTDTFELLMEHAA